MACSILKKLYNREIKGTIKQHRRQRQCQFFNKIPTRLCFRLPSLVSEEALEEGHVFLGFTKCGQFVVSYTCTMDADHQSVLPVCTYEYRLQWWWFVPNQPLKKVSEVKLFGEEELTVDLYISFCEWPSDHTKVLIFGHSLPSQTQDGCSSCYMTITSVPPLQQCEFCQVISSDEDKKQKPIKIPCMKHAFSVHTKFELTPPFPPFGPRTIENRWCCCDKHRGFHRSSDSQCGWLRWRRIHFLHSINRSFSSNWQSKQGPVFGESKIRKSKAVF